MWQTADKSATPGTYPSASMTRLAWWVVFGLLILFAVSIIGYLVWRADQGQATALEALLLAILAIIASSAASLMVGKWLSEDSSRRNLRHFLRTAFRNHGELVAGLYRVVRKFESTPPAGDGDQRLRWTMMQELVHEQCQRALDGLENWRELLPEGVNQFEANWRDMLAEQEELSALISEIKGLSPVYKEAGHILHQLKREQERLAQASLSAVESPLTGKPRRLLLNGAYREAITAYSQLILKEPQNYTLYLARSRAKYGAGDEKGALSDIDEAEKLQPEDAAVARVRDAVKAGNVPALAPALPSTALKNASEGIKYVAAGDGDKALEAFQRAEEAGLIQVFVQQNCAMAHLVKSDVTSARESLAQIAYDSLGSYVKVQQDALVALCSILSGEDATPQLQLLDQSLDECPDFSLQQSPLRALDSGLKRNMPLDSRPAQVFDKLRGKPKLAEASSSHSGESQQHMVDGFSSLAAGDGDESP